MKACRFAGTSSARRARSAWIERKIEWLMCEIGASCCTIDEAEMGMDASERYEGGSDVR